MGNFTGAEKGSATVPDVKAAPARSHSVAFICVGRSNAPAKLVRWWANAPGESAGRGSTARTPSRYPASGPRSAAGALEETTKKSPMGFSNGSSEKENPISDMAIGMARGSPSWGRRRT